MPNRFENLAVQKLSPVEWAVLSEKAHLITFHETRSASLDRIDFALLGTENGLLIGYLTAREFNKDSLYWQFGGAFPSSKDSIKVYYMYQKFVHWTKEAGYQKITTLVENKNVRYLKLAMKFGFRIIGCRFYEGSILVELMNDFSSKEESDE